MSTATIQGELWGAYARDWAQLQEPKHTVIWNAMLDATDAHSGTTLVDLGCGAGGASKIAIERGAMVNGLDASAALIEIAAEQVPDGKFRVADLEDLPYDSDSFDVALAANSIQFAGDPLNALAEIARVSRQGAKVAVTVWGMPEQCDTRHIFEAVVGVLPEKPPGGGPFALSMPGVLDGLMRQAGLTPIEELTVSSEMAYPDLDTAWRGTRSAGPLQGAIRAVGEEPVRQAVHNVLRQFQNSSGEVSMMNEFKILVAEA